MELSGGSRLRDGTLGAPRLSAIGSLGASGMFVVTLSVLFTTPNIGEGAPFLLKDLTLLGAALWSAGEALEASGRRRRPRGPVSVGE